MTSAEHTCSESGVQPQRHTHQSFAHRFVREPGENHVLQLVQLRFHGSVDPWICVPEEARPPRADAIDIPIACEILEPYTGSAPDRNQRQVFVIFHLRARMPHVREIPNDEGLIGAVRGSHRAASHGQIGFIVA